MVNVIVLIPYVSVIKRSYLTRKCFLSNLRLETDLNTTIITATEMCWVAAVGAGVGTGAGDGHGAEPRHSSFLPSTPCIALEVFPLLTCRPRRVWALPTCPLPVPKIHFVAGTFPKNISPRNYWMLPKHFCCFFQHKCAVPLCLVALSMWLTREWWWCRWLHTNNPKYY